MKLRRLNDKGIEAFANYLQMLRDQPTLPPPTHLLEESPSSEQLPTTAEVLPRVFPSRLAAAEYLYGVLSVSGLANIARDRGLWAWLTLFYFDQVCPADHAKSRKPGESARYIPEFDNYKRFYRHLLAGPFFIYSAHSDNPSRAGAVLVSQLSKPGDVVEQIASRHEMITNKSVLGTLTKLYIDPEENKLKRGAGGKSNGAARRFADVMGQFELTFDLYAISESNLVELLPKEFKRFKPSAI